MLTAASPITTGFPAINVLRLNANRRVESRPATAIAADEVLLTAVQHPPRIGETRPIAQILPAVLARYGLEQPQTSTAHSLDVLA
jgi:hypothetical protein